MRRYSFQDVTLVINGVMITGWSNGDDVIRIRRRSNAIQDYMGLDGSMMVSVSSDRSGEISFKLLQTSSSNAFLMSLCSLQESGGTNFKPVSVTFHDTFRQDAASGVRGYIQKPVDLIRGAKGSETQWVIVVEHLDMLLGDVDG